MQIRARIFAEIQGGGGARLAPGAAGTNGSKLGERKFFQGRTGRSGVHERISALDRGGFLAKHEAIINEGIVYAPHLLLLRGLRWPSVVGKRYSVQASTTPEFSDSTNLVTKLEGTGQELTFQVEPPSSPGQRYYRIVVED